MERIPENRRADDGAGLSRHWRSSTSLLLTTILLFPLLFLRSDVNKTLPLALLEFRGQYVTNYPVLFSGVLVATIPMIIAYVFLQRYFIEGMTGGAMKG